MNNNEHVESDFLSRTDALLIKKTISISDLADLLDISRSTIFNYRTGKVTPSTRVLKRLNDLESDVFESDVIKTEHSELNRAIIYLKRSTTYLEDVNLDRIKLLGVISILRKSAALLEKIEENDELL